MTEDVSLAGENINHGFVTISLESTVPEPSTWAMMLPASPARLRRLSPGQKEPCRFRRLAPTATFSWATPGLSRHRRVKQGDRVSVQESS